MRWIKLFFLSSVLFISAVIFGSQPTYAISQSIDYTSNPGRNTVVYDSSSNSLGFVPVYVRVSNIVTGNCTSSLWYNVFQLKKGTSTETVPIMFDSTCFYDVTYFVTPELTQIVYSSNSFPTGQIRFTFYDSSPFESAPCPPIPEDSQTLLDIKKAIYTIPAVLLVIYFFYIMFGWYLGGRQ